MDQENRDLRTITACLLVLCLIAVAAALRWLAPLMIPFVLALFCAFVLTEVADWLMKVARFPKWLALFSSLLASLLIFTLVAALMTNSLRKMASNADLYQKSSRKLLVDLTAALPLDRIGIDVEAEVESLLSAPVSNIGKTMLAFTNGMLDFIKQWFLVLIFVLFLLIGWRGPADPREGVRGQIQSSVRRFLAAKTIISAITGFLVGTILWILGVPLALVFGVFAFLLNFIPSIGSIAATLLPLPLVLISPDSDWGTLLLALAIPGGIQITIGNFIEPKIMGDSLDIHPVTILLSLIFWGMLWGVVGMFLATPITVVLKILFSQFPYTQPVAELMGGKLSGFLK